MVKDQAENSRTRNTTDVAENDVLEAVLPAFKWLTFGGFVLDLVESFLYSEYIGVVFVPIYNFLNRKWGNEKGA